MILNDGMPIDMVDMIETKPFSELVDSEYNVFIIDYSMQFMKFFYNEFSLEKIKSLIIEIDCVDSVIDGEWVKGLPSLFIMYRESFEHNAYLGKEGRILFIEDYI